MKREKPIRGRAHLYCSETGNFEDLILHIIYPCGKHEWLGFLWDSDWDISLRTIEDEKQFNKLFGWKTHFLGNL